MLDRYDGNILHWGEEYGIGEIIDIVIGKNLIPKLSSILATHNNTYVTSRFEGTLIYRGPISQKYNFMKGN
jgi:hypothetical protein